MGNEALKHIRNNTQILRDNIRTRQELVKEELGITAPSLIIAYEIGDNKKVLEIQKTLKEQGFMVGAIRQPTVKVAIMRIIAKLDISTDDLKKVCQIIKSY